MAIQLVCFLPDKVGCIEHWSVWLFSHHYRSVSSCWPYKYFPWPFPWAHWFLFWVKSMLVQKIIPITSWVCIFNKSCSIVGSAFTRCNICDAKGKKWYVNQQQHGNCCSSKRKEEDW